MTKIHRILSYKLQEKEKSTMQTIDYIIGILGAAWFAALVLAITTDMPSNEDGSLSKADKIRVGFVTVSLIVFIVTMYRSHSFTF